MPISVFFIASMLVHGVLVLVLMFSPEKKPIDTATYIELTMAPSTQERLPETSNSVPKLKDENLPKAQQVVEQDVNPVSEPPVKTRLLSASNQKVAKETVAQKSGEFKNRTTIAKSTLIGTADGAKVSSNLSNPSENTKVSIPASKSLPDPSADLMFKSYGLPSSNVAQTEKVLGKNGTGNKEQNLDSLQSEESQSQDYLKEKDKGMVTLLNTREFKYYSYYSRIRRQLSQHWESKVREKLVKIFKQGRSPAATAQDRITKLMIILNSQGTLVRVQVLRDSGVSDLDDAAIEAFRAAAPFPNPPAGIVENDGTVKISWDFVLET